MLLNDTKTQRGLIVRCGLDSSESISCGLASSLVAPRGLGDDELANVTRFPAALTIITPSQSYSQSDGEANVDPIVQSTCKTLNCLRQKMWSSMGWGDGSDRRAGNNNPTQTTRAPQKCSPLDGPKVYGCPGICVIEPKVLTRHIGLDHASEMARLHMYIPYLPIYHTFESKFQT